MFILAHPDDESLGMGGAAAKYAAEGADTYLVTATRGERGWFGEPAEYPGPAALGRMREAELSAAAATLDFREVTFLDYLDGDLDRADPAEATSRIVAELRRVRPQVVVTFDPWGFYGHPDHIAISQFASAAVVAAANPLYLDAPGMAHQVSKLYFRAFTRDEQEAYEAAFGDLAMNIDGVERRSTTWPDWSLTTRIDTLAYWSRVWEAITCHRTQLPGYQTLRALPDEYHQQLWGTQTYYRAFSLVNGGRMVEDDLFAGVRETMQSHLLRLPARIH
jgi:LmbE family N-acetylglucosaminyl deacetylase